MDTKDSKETEIVVENDEMEDGSIFVCFMCEQEFRKVSLLNEHMQMHQNMPELHKELPSRRSRGRGRGRPRGRGRGRGAPPVQVKEEPVDDDDIQYVKNVVQPLSDGGYVKPESNTFCSSRVKKAQRIRQYFQSRGWSDSPAKKPMRYSELDDFSEFGFMAEEDDIMISPPPSKKSTSGPTIMNAAEPEGFICPSKTYASKFQPKTKCRKNVRIRKKLIVKEVVYEEVDDYEDGEEDNTAGDETSHHKVTSSNSEEEEMEADDDEDEQLGEIIELSEEDSVMEFPARYTNQDQGNRKKPGRRSQPRDGSEKEPGIPCDECGKEFRSITTLRVHQKAHLEVREIPCPYCDETFPQRHVLHQHLLSQHQEISNLICPVCQKVFTRTDSLKSHMVRMHEEDGGLNCYICGKNFPSQGQLEMHVRVHTGERPFKCDYCGKGFVQKVHLRTHLRTMHNMQEIQNTPCRICNAMLDGRAGLREHYNTIHGLTNNQYKSRVAKLRKEGKIPELPPPVVKEVDPSLNYFKVSISELTEPATTSVTTSKKTYSGRGAGRMREFRKNMMKASRNTNNTSLETPPLEVVKIEKDTPRRRDQEELSIVESAFKVAEQMEQLEGTVSGSTTILVAGEDSATTGVYYAIPVVMESDTTTSTTTTTTTTASTLNAEDMNSSQQLTSTTTITTNGTTMVTSSNVGNQGIQQVDMPQEDIDEEYAQFAAEHSHITHQSFNSDANLGNKGSIVKAEPLQLFTDPNDPSQAETVEMFTM